MLFLRLKLNVYEYIMIINAAKNCNVLIKLCSSIPVFWSACGPLNVQWFAGGIESSLFSFWIISNERKELHRFIYIDPFYLPFAWHVLAKVVRFYHRIIITIMAKIQFWLQFPPWHGTGLYLTQHTYRFPTYFSPILASIELTLCFEWLARDTDHRIHFIHSILNLSKPKNSIKHRNITQNAGSSS